MRIAINTGVLASSVREAWARGLVFRISVSKCRLDRGFGGHRQHLAGDLRAGKVMVASTFQRGRWQCVD
jgi:hypothetical protein